MVAFKHIKEIEPLSLLGADEFYCGVKRIHSPSLLLNVNRRCMDDLSRRCNLRSYDELKAALEISHSLGRKVFLTLNENYTRHQFKQVLKELEEISKIDVDGLIVTDLNLILELQKNYGNIPIHISMLSTVFNSECVKFYKGLGASRIIFPRSIFVDELKSIRKKCPDIELETFIDYFIHCPNVEGFCSSIHNLNPLIPTLCGREYLFRVNAREEIPPETNSTCRLCNVYDYLKIGIDAMKLTGREYPFQVVYVSLYIVKELVKLARRSKSKQEFVSVVCSRINEIIEEGFKALEDIPIFRTNKRTSFQLKQMLKSGMLCQKLGRDLCYFQKEVV